MSSCRTCGRNLDFIKTKGNRPMPVEHTSYTGTGRPLPFGSYINKEGEVMKHDEVPDGVVVWRIHFQDCEGASMRRQVVMEAYEDAFTRAFAKVEATRPFIRNPVKAWGRHETYGHIAVHMESLKRKIYTGTGEEIEVTLLLIIGAVLHFLTTGDKYRQTDLIPPTPKEIQRWIKDEVVGAVLKHGDAPWPEHEMLGVLIEEVDEVLDNIKADGDPQNLQKELLQVAAVCIRHLTRPLVEE